MNGNRRRKKRPNYGVRTIELAKGLSGFGFTISGQAPCILSCIAAESPAERAGLRPGDYLIAVNGQNVSKSPHDDVVRLIGQSKVIKLQIAENYYSDSSDDEFSSNRPKPKYPNRFRNKYHQSSTSRVEKVVRDLQNGAIFDNDPSTVYCNENNSNLVLPDRNLRESHCDRFNLAVSSNKESIPDHNFKLPLNSPGKLRRDQFPYMSSDARPTCSTKDNISSHPQCSLPFPKPREQTLVSKTKNGSQQSFMGRRPLVENHQQNHFTFDERDNSGDINQFHKSSLGLQNVAFQQNENIHTDISCQKGNGLHSRAQNRHLQKYLERTNDLSNSLQNSKENRSFSLPSPSSKGAKRFQGIAFQKKDMLYSHQSLPQTDQYVRQSLLKRSLNKSKFGKNDQPETSQSQFRVEAACSYHRDTSDQELGMMNVQDSSLSTSSQSQRSREEKLYRAVVGYLGTIEMPKEQQGHSRLTTIRNCIRRLRIEKKVHTLVLMSVYRDSVVLTNPHGLKMAEYPAERITFCGIYADDKKFFGLITAHDSFIDNLSDASHGDRQEEALSISSSCHVFMVDPDAACHPDHNHRAVEFRLECTAVTADNGCGSCMEFPKTADPILHSIIGLYRSRVGSHRDNFAAPGLVGVNAQASPQMSNSSSNSSNSDSGIGFRDDGQHQYHNAERVLVMDYNGATGGRPQGTRARGNVPSGPTAAYPHSQMSLERPNSLVSQHNASSHDETFDCNNLSKSISAISGNQYLSHEKPPTDTKKSYVQLKEKDFCYGQRKEDFTREIPKEGTKSTCSNTNTLNVVDDATENTNNNNDKTLTPSRDCKSPFDADRLTVRAMPDPMSFDPKSPGQSLQGESPQISSIRDSMHKYLQHKQEHLVKVSQKINKRDSACGGSPLLLNSRAFSPFAAVKTPLNVSKSSCKGVETDLSMKLSPKVYGVAFKPNAMSAAASERSFTRSLEDIRDSSANEEKMDNSYRFRPPSVPHYRDGGSESDNNGFLGGSASSLNKFSYPALRNEKLQKRAGAFRSVVPRGYQHINRHAHPTPSSVNYKRFSGADSSSFLDVSYLSKLIPSKNATDGLAQPTETSTGHGCNLDALPYGQDDLFHDSDLDHVDGSDPRKPRGISLRRLARSRNSSETGATSDSNTGHSDNEFPKSTGPSIRVGSEGSFPPGTPAESSRVGAWAASFEKLLDDPAGLHTFAEFLKKEYSHENIYFWTACERYKCISNDEERREVAKNIFERHLGSSASEPVNVDSHARQKAQEGLAASPNESLFLAAQKQIFNLMKFDSYSRFLKSDLYNSCLSHERKGLPLPYSGDVSLDPDFESKESQYSKLLKKSKSDVDDRRRKSLLPWHRKDRSKSKDRGEAEFGGLRKKNDRTQSESSSSRFELFGSRTSLASSDRVMSKESLTSCEAASLSSSDGASLCRFILPDRSNSVLVVRSGETIRELVRQLLDKRRIRFTDYNVVFTKNNKLVDLNKESTVLGGQEVRVERMVLFGLHLPSRKTVIVKAKPHKIVGDVLKPILSKYGLKLDLMFIHKMGDDKSVNLKATVTELDGQKFMVQTKEAVKEWSDPGRISRSNNVLDEITNRVFEDLLRGKEQNAFDDLGVLDFDSRSTKTEPTSESSSSVLGMESSRRESLSIDRNSLFFGRGLKSDDLPTKKNQNFVSQPKPKTDSTHHQDDTDLYEGLKRAQLFRLDDQRGTEINIELPDFLKADRKENLSASLAPSALMNGNLSSKAHPEIWGGAQDSPSTTTGGDDTLVASPEGVDSEEGESGVDEGRRTPNTHQLKNNQARQSQWSIGSSGQVNSAFKEDPKKVSENVFENTKNLDTFKQIEIEGSLTAVLTPPPPLPPKPTMGGIKRGPPPRPPSRPPPHSLVRSIQFHDSHSRINENAVLADKFSVSFV